MQDGLYGIFAFFSFWLGASIASFLNVVIWRVPRGESIVRPPSHCPKCGAPVRWWQNIPVLSWLALRGRCANCKEPISPRYILVEALGGCLFLAVFLRYAGLGGLFSIPVVLVMWTWIALMIAGSFIDFDHQLLPDFVTVGGMVLGTASAAVWWLFGMTVPPALHEGPWLFGLRFVHLLSPFPAHIVWSLAGLAFGFGLLWLVRFLGSLAFKREAMGMGDVFLMGAVGALFGPVAVLVTLIFSSVFGSIAGIGLLLAAKAKLGRFIAIPYGPYICLGCLVWIFCGPELVDAYLSCFR